jgi:phosphohistidine swiveling domain-containing protein
MNEDYSLKGTKAETLSMLSERGFNVPKVYYFSISDWHESHEQIIDKILDLYISGKVVVRSSTKAEDSDESSMAGVFESVLNVSLEKIEIRSAINTVIDSYDGNPENHVLIQPMVTDVVMSGVIMTRVLDDGSPYYVFNYDDQTGHTDTVTSGSTINKTVYIYNGVEDVDFDNPLLLSGLKMVRRLELLFKDIPLDIEFAIDSAHSIKLLQVRKITTISSWNSEIIKGVSDKMVFLKDYVNDIMQPRTSLFGRKTLLGFMPDWNPAEMIGVVPRPLAQSLYRTLITRKNWRLAREQMGYRKMPNVELMLSLFGRPYIDCRNSFNSFLPENITDQVAEKLINAYLGRLEQKPYLHDKIEFDVVFTALDFSFEDEFAQRYSDVLKNNEFESFKLGLKKITLSAILGSSLQDALNNIHLLSGKQKIKIVHKESSFALADSISTLLDECSELGTLPFSILARHGFIAESLLRSAVKNNVLTEERLNLFRRSIMTVSGEMSADYSLVKRGNMSSSDYLEKYGHLRPSSYDILSPNYSNRSNLFDGSQQEFAGHSKEVFKLSAKETEGINQLIGLHFDSRFTAEELFSYAQESIKGREYAKFIFTKHLSNILELTSKWGNTMGLTRDNLSYLTIDDILNHLYRPTQSKTSEFYSERVLYGRSNYELASSFKLSYLIRSERDVHIVPMQRSVPNFIGSDRIEAEVVILTPHMKTYPSLEDKIICIEGADPGYDWVFTKNIAGLITKFGGANSHMAIRSAEYGIPAAIGCGEQTFDRIIAAKRCLIDGLGKRLEPLFFN